MTNTHVCPVHGNPLRPGGPLTDDQCALPACWERFGLTRPGLPPAPPPRSLPCVHEGAVIEYAACGSELRHVRDCDRHDRCTRGPSKVQSCRTCPDYAPPPGAVDFHLFAAGIGDAVSGLYAACGLADAGHRAVYHCRHAAWLAGASHPGVAVVRYAGDTAVNASHDPHGELVAAGRGAVGSRAAWYCDQIARQAGVPAFRPARPAAVARPPRPAFLPAGGYVAVAPFSAHANRQWPHFGELADRLAAAGRRVVAIDGPRGGVRMGKQFDARRHRLVSWHWGLGVPDALGVIAHAEAYVGNDSGMTHVAALHAVPAVAVMSQVPVAHVFDAVTAPTVAGVTADGWACQGCAWQRPCPTPGRCGALQSTPVDKVFAAVAAVGRGAKPLPVLAEHELDGRLDVREQGLVGAGQGG